VTEGRRAFLARYAGIEAGAECERWAPVVAALVDGEATAEQLAAARPHLRRCAACRATVRELRVAGPGLAGVLPAVPLVAVAGSSGAGGRVEGALRAVESLWAGVQERAGLWVVKVQGGVEAVSGAKLAAVASAAVVAGGSGAVAVSEVQRAEQPRRAARTQAATPATSRATAKVALVTPTAPTRALRTPAVASKPRATAPAPERRPGEFGGSRSTRAHEFQARTSRTVREFRAAPAAAPDPVATTAVAPPAAEFRVPKAPSAATSPATPGSAVVEPGSGGEFGGG